MGWLGDIFGQAAGSGGGQNYDEEDRNWVHKDKSDKKPPPDKGKADKHYKDEQSKGGEGNGGEQKDGKLW